MKKNIYGIILLMWASLGLADDQGDECAMMLSMLDIAGCYESYNEKQAVLVKEILADIDKTVLDADFIKKVLDAQNFWQKYVDVHCSFGFTQDGSIAMYQKAECIFRHTKDRLKELSALNCREQLYCQPRNSKPFERVKNIEPIKSN
jgi:uncharacterized protein YecT (DUF1311 family)